MFFFEGDHYWAAFSDRQEILDPITGHEMEFLAPESANYWQAIRSETYCRSWLAARICATELWTRSMNEMVTPPWREVRIESRNSEGKSIRPVLYFRNVPIDRDISISHVDRVVLAVFAKYPGYRIGCDLVPLGSISPATAQMFFSEEEIASNADKLDFIWAVKEAAYKAGNENTSFAPRLWQVSGGEYGIFCCKNEGNPLTVQTFLHNEYVVAVTTFRSTQ